MKTAIKIAGLIFFLILLGLAALTLPSVQDRLVQTQIVKLLDATPDDLFVDDALRVVICGSASPMPVEGQAAACVMVIAGGKYYIVDTGNRSTNNLGLWRIPSDRTGAVFLTHFHSDHMGDLGEFNMVTWAQGRPAPLNVYGPKGVKRVVEGFTEAYALDSSYRTAHHGPLMLNPVTGQMIAHEIPVKDSSVVAFEDGELVVSMFPVQHAPIEPAVGYRFDYKGRSVVISGDTTKVDSIIEAARGADVLVHEALARHIVKQMEGEARALNFSRIEQLMFDIQDYHASPVEAAEVANAAGVKELVLYHLVPMPPNKVAEKVFLRGVSDVRASGVTLGHDGLLLTLPTGSKDIYFGDLSNP